MNALGPLPAQKIFPHITHGAVQFVTGIAWREAQFAAGFGMIELPLFINKSCFGILEL
jgi:hypothetical protein